MPFSFPIYQLIIANSKTIDIIKFFSIIEKDGKIWSSPISGKALSLTVALDSLRAYRWSNYSFVLAF